MLIRTPHPEPTTPGNARPPGQTDRDLREVQGSRRSPLKISVVLPVWNEAKDIAAALRRLRESAPPGELEIIVVDGGSDDGTREAALPLADKVLTAPKRGRAVQMHAGALAAAGDWVMFLHADTRLPPGGLGMIQEAAGEPSPPVWTAFSVSFDHPGRIYRCIEQVTAWRFRFSGVPHGDQAVAVRRETYLATGGYPDVPIMEEYYLAAALVSRGPVRLLPAAVVTSARRYERHGALKNALRNALVVGLFRLGVSPRLLKRMYR